MIHKKNLSIQTRDNVFAEFHGLQLAMQYIKSNNNRFKNSKFHILIDCKCVPNAAQGLEQVQMKYIPILTDIKIIQTSLKTQDNVDILFYWIPGHTRVSHGNEVADKLAKNAAREADY